MFLMCVALAYAEEQARNKIQDATEKQSDEKCNFSKLTKYFFMIFFVVICEVCVKFRTIFPSRQLTMHALHRYVLQMLLKRHQPGNYNAILI